MNINEKREREKETVSQMIRIYCRGKHGGRTLCDECRQLDEYARERSDKCPFMETKTFCSNCKVHCYKADMRDKIRAVMRYSGPRMIFYYPVTAVRHIIETNRKKHSTEVGKMNFKKIIYIIVGCIGVALGAIGAVLPLMPAFPFLLLASVCFCRSSERLDKWFKGTRLYKDNLESFVNGQGMTWKTKIRIMITVTVLMSIGFVMMDQVPVGRMVLAGIWVFHILYFCFGVKNCKDESNNNK